MRKSSFINSLSSCSPRALLLADIFHYIKNNIRVNIEIVMGDDIPHPT